MECSEHCEMYLQEVLEVCYIITKVSKVGLMNFDSLDEFTQEVERRVKDRYRKRLNLDA